MSHAARITSFQPVDSESAAAMEAAPAAVLGGIVERNVPPLHTSRTVPSLASSGHPTRAVAAAMLSPAEAPPQTAGPTLTSGPADEPDSSASAMSPPPPPPPPPPLPALCAVTAVVGRGFPCVEPGKHYGRRREPVAAVAPVPSSATASTAAAAPASVYAPVGLSAHVQPEEGDGHSAEGSDLAAETLYRPAHASAPAAAYFSVGGGASVRLAHQWRPEDFRQLLAGHYTHPLPPSWRAWLLECFVPPPSAPAPPSTASTVDAHLTTINTINPTTTTNSSSGGAAPEAAALVGTTGEAFFQQLFQCLRSTVRRHQDVALHVLLLHLQSDADARDLRERCLHGPDCASFLFFLISLMASAGHPVLCCRAAQCLVRLLPVGLTPVTTTLSEASTRAPQVTPALSGTRAFSFSAVEASAAPLPLAGLVAEVLGEVGAPLGDAPAASEADDDRPVGEEADENDEENVREDDSVFSELSEMLRQGEDARVALEKMRFTTRVLMALPSLLTLQNPSDERIDRTDTTEETQGEDAPRQAVRAVGGGSFGDALIARLLLCGGAGSCATKIAILLAESHVFRAWIEGILGDIVLGQRTLAECLEVLLLVYRVAHVPAAAAALLRPSMPPPMHTTRPHSTSGEVRTEGSAVWLDSLYETWTLFFTYVFTAPPALVDTTHRTTAAAAAASAEAESEAVGSQVSVLLLREFVRHGHRGEALVHDLVDVLLTDGLRVGSAVVLEMWLLLGQSTPASPPQPRSTASVSTFKEAALASYQFLTSASATTTPLSPTSWCGLFARTACAHYVATFLSSPSQRLTALTLLGTAVDTQERVQKGLLGAHLLTATGLSTAFLRLTSPLATSSEAITTTTTTTIASSTVAVAPLRDLSPWRVYLALQAARTYADVRLISALTAAYLGVSRSAVLGFAASLAAKFEAGAVRITDHAEQRLQNDELATMSEVVTLLDTHGPAAAAATTTTSTDGYLEQPSSSSSSVLSTPPSSAHAASHPYQHTAQVAALFTLHGIALTKHCLDAVPALICLVLGGTNRGAARGPTRDLSEAALHVSAAQTTTSAAAAAWYAERLVPTPSLSGSGTSSDTATALLPARVALALYLEEGVLQQSAVSSAVSAASTAMTGAPRSWVLFPLWQSLPLDTAATTEAETETTEAQALLWIVWSRWLRQTLGLHQRLKSVLGYDALLCHAALWTLTHRHLVFTETGPCLPVPSSPSTHLRQVAASGLTDLLAQLAGLLLQDATDDGVEGDLSCCSRTSRLSALSPAAAQILQGALQGTVDAESEAPLSVGAFVALIALATQSPAPAALTLMQILLCAPLMSTAMSAASNTEETRKAQTTSDASFRAASLSTSVVVLVEGLGLWGHGTAPSSAARGLATSSASSATTAATWSLESLVSLLELAAPLLAGTGETNGEDSLVPVPLKDVMRSRQDGDGGGAEEKEEEEAISALRRWCVSMLVNGVWSRLYLAPRLARQGALRQSHPDPSTVPSSASQVLSSMEREVLRDCLEGLGWQPREMWPYVSDTMGGDCAEW